jgi:hypothetical protein
VVKPGSRTGRRRVCQRVTKPARVGGGPGDALLRMGTQREDKPGGSSPRGRRFRPHVALVMVPFDDGLWLGVQRADKPGGSSPRGRRFRPHVVLVMVPFDDGLWLGVQRADKPGGSSPRARRFPPHPNSPVSAAGRPVAFACG